MEKDQLDKNAQLKLWRAYHRDEIAAVVDGPYRNEWRTLAKTVRDMAFENPAAIVDYVRNAQWLHDADARTRSVALATIARKIMQLRELEGYAPFDDSLPGEEPTAFEIVRSELNVLT
jgi:hypothetical protein